MISTLSTSRRCQPNNSDVAAHTEGTLLNSFAILFEGNEFAVLDRHVQPNA
jgi:hypothetical protein